MHLKGLVLADNKTRTNVIVEEIVPGGNAEKSGKIHVGDIVSRRVQSKLGMAACVPHDDNLVGSRDIPALYRCSATVLKDGMEGKYEKEGYGQRLYTNWEKIMFDCEGEVGDPIAHSRSAGCSLSCACGFRLASKCRSHSTAPQLADI